MMGEPYKCAFCGRSHDASDEYGLPMDSVAGFTFPVCEQCASKGEVERLHIYYQISVIAMRHVVEAHFDAVHVTIGRKRSVGDTDS